MVLCAHSDDEIISMGGTIAKYAKEKKDVRVIIFSSGEKSVPWLKEEVLVKKRIEESKKVSKLLGCKCEFLGLPDLKLAENLEKNARQVKKIISKFKPDKIFTHNRYDAHPDHRAVFYTLEKALRGRKRKPKLFTFMIWGLFNPKDSTHFYVDIDKTFSEKIKALREFKTQKLITSIFYMPIYIKARLAGYKVNCKFAEVFYAE